MDNRKFLLKKTFKFEAAHQLKHHDGKCARLHGHSFKLTIVVAGANLTREMDGRKTLADKGNPKTNMLLDYGDISAIVQPFVDEKLDHHFLNDTLETDSPTSEFIATYCFDTFSTEFEKLGIKLCEVRVSETCTSEAIFTFVNLQIYEEN